VGLHKYFGTREVLKGVGLTANRGDVVAIIGASGSGKSTILRCINLLESPTRGSIRVGDELVSLTEGHDGNLHPADANQLRRVRTKVGMVFQNFNLWPHMTVLQNVIEAPLRVLKLDRREAVARGEALLEKVGLFNRRNDYPAYLSGGQQQRVAIARTLCTGPDVILFDEPTSALDPELAGEVLKVIRSLAGEGRTMVIVTHELRFARELSSHVQFLNEGRVEEEGTPQQVFGHPRSVACRQFLSSVIH
jgi:octopine/nopaline transport system ATP-binding protein